MTGLVNKGGGTRRRILGWLGATVAASTVTGCFDRKEDTYRPQFSDKSSDAKQEIIFGIHPLHNPERLHAVFGPLADYLSDHVPNASFRIEASRNYASFDEKLYAGRFAFALPNPFQTVNALKHGYHVFGKMGDDENFRGIILVRKDSGIKTVADLKGKGVSFPAPTALAATMMPQFYLKTHGLDVMKDIDIRYVGSQESSIMNVYLKSVAAGATWPPPWKLLSEERPELAEALYPIWQTDSLPNNGLVARNDVPKHLVDKVAGLLFTLHEHQAGRSILAAMDLSKFETANDETYDPVVTFLRKFSEEVRPVE